MTREDMIKRFRNSPISGSRIVNAAEEYQDLMIKGADTEDGIEERYAFIEAIVRHIPIEWLSDMAK